MREFEGSGAFGKIHEGGLGAGLVLAEQRREAGDASPGSRYGFLGSAIKRLMRRLLRFQSLRQTEFNTGTVRALREAENHLRLVASEIEGLRQSVVKLDQESHRRVDLTLETVDAHTKQLEAQGQALEERRLHEQRLEIRVREFQAMLRGLEDESSRLESLLEEGMQSRAREAEQRAQRLEEQRLWLEGRLGDLAKSVARTEPVIEEWGRWSAQYEGHLDAQNRAIDEHARRLGEQESHSERLETALGEVRGPLEQLTALREPLEQLLSLRESLAGLEALRASVAELESLRGQFAQLQNDASRQEQESSQRAEAQVQRTNELERGLHELTGVLEHLRGEGLSLGSRLSELAEELRARIQSSAEQLSQELNQRVEQQQTWVQAQAGRFDLLGGRIDEVLGKIPPIERVDRIEQDTAALGEQLPALAAELRGRLVTLAQRVDPVLPLDYVGFERRFRGEESMIRDRMRKYAGVYGNVRRVLDVGCGRGEFLEICREHGVGAYGVDADSDMVSCCGLKGLEVVHDDLLHHLEALSDRCLDGIFSAQVIEHLSPADLIRFLQLASAKLRRGAMLVLETVNTDTFTALRTFFVDMTHKRPIPARSLQFLVEAAGFSVQQVIYSSPIPDEVKMRPLPPPPPKGGSAQIATMRQLYNENCDRLNDLLFGPQDYAVVAQR